VVTTTTTAPAVTTTTTSIKLPYYVIKSKNVKFVISKGSDKLIITTPHAGNSVLLFSGFVEDLNLVSDFGTSVQAGYTEDYDDTIRLVSDFGTSVQVVDTEDYDDTIRLVSDFL